MFKIHKTHAMSGRGRQVVYNVRRFISDKFAGRPPIESKKSAPVSSNLPCIVKNGITPLNMPYIGINRIRNPITIPTIMSSFFNKTFNDLARELLLIEPIKSAEPVAVGSKQPFNTAAEFTDKGMTLSK
ncbi:unnamed protein product [Nezara viridula]|uniref:Uncharacterized protein n=1 Tax=Nezara viridula TaxID=85310 RepID=A0A9P0HPF3_NEZVI|nr:unnamed protein product [Nezara viridula]